MIAALLERFKRRQVGLAHTHLVGHFLARGLAPERFGERTAYRGKLFGAATDLAHVAFVIHDHDVANNPYLMAMRLVILERDRGDDARLARIGDVDDRRAEMFRIGNVPDKRMRAAHRDLSTAGEIEMTQTADVAGEAGSRSVNRVHAPFSRATPKSCGSPVDRGIVSSRLHELNRDAAECAKVGMQRIALIREHHARERARQNEMTGLERNSMAGELIGKPSHAERGMAEYAGRNPGLLDLGILVHDATDPAQVDVKRLNRPTANDDSGRRAIIGDGIENPARVLQARVDYLDRGHDVFGRTQHLG